MIANNPRVIETDSTLVDTNQITKETFAYDCFNNKTDTYEYDFAVGAAGALVRHAHTNYVTATSYTDAVNGPHLRNLVSQTSIYNAGGVERGRATYEYDNYNTDANHAGLTDRPSISGLDPSFNTLYTTRGNVTATTHYLLNDSGSVTGSITAYAQDDIAGNVVKVIDGRGFATTLEFSDRFGTPDGEAELNPGPTNLGGQTSYAFPTKVTNFLGHIAYTQFDYYLGRPVDAKDANGIVSSGYFNDVLDRPSQVIRASNPGTGIKSQTSFSYDDTNRIVTTTSDLNAFNDPNPLKSQVLFDSLGRTIETRQYEDAANYIAVQTQYDSLGRPFKVSNPFRPWQSEIAIWTTSGFDALGRVVSVTTPDSAVVTTSYSGNSVTVMDQLGRQRKSVTDGLGRLTQVYEDPTALNYLTSYSHDVLDNLTMVAQGSQTRTFVYDSLKRLTSATNPESGTVSYSYDNNSNLLSKTDARGVVSSYVYDALNRNTTIDYSDTTGLNPDITLVYDGAVNGKGRLWESYAGGNLTLGANVEHTKIQSYDPLGRPLIQVQDFKSNNVWGPGYQMQRSYNLAGGVTSQTYPSSEHTVSYSYDSAGRTSAFTGNLGDGVPRTYSTGIVYSPLGGMTKEQFGTDPALYNKLFYNSRGQLSEIREGTSYTGPTDTGWERGAIINFYGACWGMCGGSNSTTPMTDNNGNLKRQETYIPNGGPTFAQTFDYDSLNRLQRVTEGSSWQQEYIYDPYGNRTIHQTSTWGSGINKKDFTVNTANNRLGVPTGQTGALTYDNAGNLTNDTYTGAGSRTYDAENRMTTAWGGNNQSQIYTYNANGQRTRRKVDGVETWQIYGFGGELLAEYAANAAVTTPQKEYGYRNGQLLITATVNAAGWGAPPSYTGPNPLSTSDQIKLENLTELRSAVNQLRQHAGLSSFSFTVDPSPDHSTTVKADHIRQLRTALEQARTALGLSTGGYAHPTLTENTSWIYAIDFQELRNQIASAWNSGSGVDIRWLMTDQLGTPRMVFDKTGALANMSRHDYLPFGEELFAGTGGRTSDQGYPTSPNAIDAARQKFTQKERDNETGLDYFGARYYASLQGRFTSVDPLMASASTTDPQSLNRYAYVRNRPLGSIDPNGMDDCEIGKTCSFTTDDWATSGNHPEEGQIQESVDVNIGPSQPLTTSSFDPEAVPLNLIDLAKPVLLDQYVPTPGTMPNSGGHDTPDPNNFAQLNVSIAALVVTADFSVTRDDFGNWYVGAGPGLGLGFPVGGSFVTGTTISDLGIPTYDETSVRDILGGPSTTVTAGAGLVGTRSWNNPVVLGNTIPIIPSSEGGGTRGIGLGTPQIGISQQDVLRIPYLRF